MLDIEFEDEPSMDEVEALLERVKSASYQRGGRTPKLMNVHPESDTLRINFEQLKHVILEHQMYEQAQGFTSNEVLVLRVLETGRDRMRFGEIEESVNERRKDASQPPLAESTIRNYVRKLRDKGLVETEGSGPTTLYTYTGP